VPGGECCESPEAKPLEPAMRLSSTRAIQHVVLRQAPDICRGFGSFKLNRRYNFIGLFVLLFYWFSFSSTAFAQTPRPAPTPGLSVGSDTMLSHARTTSRPWAITAGASYNANISRAQINAFAGSVLCGVFQRGNAARPGFYLGATSPKFGSGITLEPELIYRDLSSSFETTPTNVEHGYVPNVGIVQIDRLRTYDAKLSTISLGLLVGYDLFSWLKIEAGPSLGFFVKKNFHETEQIVSPAGASYDPTTPTTLRTIGDGKVSTSALQPSLELGLRMQFSKDSRLQILPEIRSTIPMTTISNITGQNWRTFSIGGGIALSYLLTSPLPQIEPPPLVPKKDTLVAQITPPIKKRSVLNISIRAVGLTDHGEEISEPVLSVERMHVTEVFPTLNRIFFDDGDTVLAERYHQYANANVAMGFSEKQLFSADAMRIHHNILDLLGKRLREHPNANVTLSGARSTASPGDVNFKNDIALDRANQVARYLETIWGIAPSRIRIKSRGLPELPSDEGTPAGQAENRRVEITSPDPAITGPLWTERIEKVATPPKIVFYPYFETSAGIKSYSITVHQGAHVLQTFEGGSGGAVGEHLWTLGENSMPGDRDSLVYDLFVTDSTGTSATTRGVIRLKQEQRDTAFHLVDTSQSHRIERFSLILFDYSSSQFGKHQSDELLDEIAKVAVRGAQVTLTGHTDRTGDDAFNDRLSGERAMHTAEALRARLRQAGRAVPNISTEAHGSRDVLFDNSIPEGRFLSRTVRVTVEHPPK
jgi:outer membrane protein OmpA-like peptidoglycan-associated protein